MRRKIKISVTDIDQYQYYLDSETLSLDDYILRLKRMTAPTEAMQRGIDFHSVMENYLAGTVEKGHGLEYDFDFSRVDAKILQPDAREVANRITIPIGNWDVTFSGRLDAISGDVGIDYKTSMRGINCDTYLSAWQWRLYLMLFPNLSRFRYDFFRIQKQARSFYYYDVIEHNSLMCSKYPDMTKDVKSFVSAYLGFLENLEKNGSIKILPTGIERGIQHDKSDVKKNGWIQFSHGKETIHWGFHDNDTLNREDDREIEIQPDNASVQA